MLETYIKRILQARVYDVAKETPLTPAKKISARFKNKILLKREDMQPIHSFKIRGAYNKMVSLPPILREKGVITASAGNHAQGVALAGQKLQIPVLVVMAKTASEIKISAVKELGAEVILWGDTYEEAAEHAEMLQQEKNLAYIHPFDDPDVIAGQGTIGMEILHHHTSPLSAIFVPVGGGGLIAGIAAFVKYVRPEIKIIGVEPEDSNCLYESLKAHTRVCLKHIGTFADGVATKQVGAANFEILKDLVETVILVNKEEICEAIKDIYDDMRSVAEPAGALATAGLKKYLGGNTAIQNETFVAIHSGANISFERLYEVVKIVIKST